MFPFRSQGLLPEPGAARSGNEVLKTKQDGIILLRSPLPGEGKPSGRDPGRSEEGMVRRAGDVADGISGNSCGTDASESWRTAVRPPRPERPRSSEVRTSATRLRPECPEMPRNPESENRSPGIRLPESPGPAKREDDLEWNYKIRI